MCLTCSSPEHKGHLHLSVFHLTSFNCHIPASNHAIALLSYLEQHSTYSFLPQEESVSLYSVNKLLPEKSANILYFNIIALIFHYLCRFSHIPLLFPPHECDCTMAHFSKMTDWLQATGPRFDCLLFRLWVLLLPVQQHVQCNKTPES
jgi:hypothetical protein